MVDWERVHRAMDFMNDQLQVVETAEDFQAVGLLAREALISLAQAVYDPAVHSSPDGVEPSETDAKRMLDAYLIAAIPGSSNEEARKFARSAVALADALQHRRSAARIDGELCAAAVGSVVRVVEITSGQESYPREPWQGIELEGRYFAWSGPSIHALEDCQPVPTPQGIENALREVGMTPSFGVRDRLNHHLAQGGHQVFETDKRRWRRELLYKGDGRQVLLVKEERR